MLAVVGRQRLLGKGGHGEVYEAVVGLENAHHVALKVAPIHGAQNEQELAAVRRSRVDVRRVYGLAKSLMCRRGVGGLPIAAAQPAPCWCECS